MLERVGVGDAGEAFAAGAEGGAGNDRDAVLEQQLFAKLLACHAEAADIWENVEGALGGEAADAHLTQARDKVGAAAVVFRLHFRDILVASTKCLDCRHLRGCGSAHDSKLMNLEHFAGDGGGCGGDNEGDVASVKIVSLTTFGAFAEIVDGVDGLIHISQIADKRIAHPSDVLEVGQVVDAKIVGIDTENKKVSLSIRALLQPAEEAVEEAAAEEVAEEAPAADAE